MPYSILFSGLLLLYAITVMMLLLDLHPMELGLAKRVVFLVGVPLLLAGNTLFMTQLDLQVFGKYYPVLNQLPVFLLFCGISRHNITKVFFALLTTIFVSFPYTMSSFFIRRLTSLIWLRAVALILMMGVLLWCIRRWMKPDFDYIMDYFTDRAVLKFSIIPILHNILNYSIGHYTREASTLPLRSLVFLSGLAAYLLTMDLFRSAKEMQRLKSEQLLMETKMAAVDNQLAAIRTTQEQSAVYRHDMRHHLALIKGYLGEGEVNSAMEYINRTQSDIEVVTPVRYCRNNTVNLILSFFVAKAERAGVTLQVQAELPQTISLPETELCAILSNGLENAIAAAANSAVTEKTVEFRCYIHQGNLLITIKNGYKGKVVLENGLPQSNREGHGFGSRSIEMLTKKHDGYCAFETENGIFTLRVALPLGG